MASTGAGLNLYFSPGDAGRFFTRTIEADLPPGFKAVYAASLPVRTPVFDLDAARHLLDWEPIPVACGFGTSAQRGGSRRSDISSLEAGSGERRYPGAVVRICSDSLVCCFAGGQPAGAQMPRVPPFQSPPTQAGSLRYGRRAHGPPVMAAIAATLYRQLYRDLSLSERGKAITITRGEQAKASEAAPQTN